MWRSGFFNLYLMNLGKVFEEIPELKYKDLVTEDSNNSYDILKIEGWKGKFDACCYEHKLFIEYDGSYWHKDRLENYRKESLRTKKGFRFLRIRQQPLDKISIYDALVPEGFDENEYAEIAIDAIEEYLIQKNENNMI